MKKICFITSAVYSIGGEQSVLTLIANELSKDYSVTIYTHENINEENVQQSNLNSNIEVIRAPKSRKGFIYLIVMVANRFFKKYFTKSIAQYFMKLAYYPQKTLNYWTKEINEKNYDVVITVSGSRSFSILMGYIYKDITAKIIAWEHSSYEAYFSYISSYYYNRKTTFINEVSKLDECVVLNDDIAEKYEKELGIKAKVIHNPCKPYDVFKSKFSNKIFIACGRLEAEKGYELLVEAFSIFHAKNKEWKLLLIGDGSRRKTIKQLIEKYQLEKYVIMPGYQTDVAKYYANASIFLMSSKWEGFPMTVLEAFQAGLPIIAFDIPALKPLVSNGKEGYLVEPGNVTDMAKAMLELASNLDKIQTMSEHVNEKIKNFSINLIVSQWKMLIDE